MAVALAIVSAAMPAAAEPFVFQLEGGIVNKKDTYDDPTWDTVDLKYSYEFPIILAIPNTNGGNPADFRLRNITQDSFELTLAEPPSEDGPHIAMDVSYVAVELGQWLLPDGQLVAAGTINTTQLIHSGGGDTFTVNLPQGFTNPVVFAQLQTLNNEQGNLPSEVSDPWLTVAVKDVTANNFQLALEGSECTSQAPSMSEKVGWMAIDAGVNSNFVDDDGVAVTYETLLTGTNITGWDNGGSNVSFNNDYGTTPLFVAKLQSRNEADGGWPRFYNLGDSSVFLLVDEDACADNERSNAGESAGLFVFSNSFRVQDDDPDNDDIASSIDNCPLIANPDQADSDVPPDGEGDVCDCGDGMIVSGETCDDNNETAGDGCHHNCGVEVGWECTGEPSICTEICGDGLIVGSEGCDDGATGSGDGCSANCNQEPGWDCTGEPSVCTEICGDGLIVGDEECDDGSTADGDGCSPTCTVEPGWDCSGAPSECSEICGDGLVVGIEQCDDGNTAANDGCSLCTIEAGWSCTGEPSVCTPGCGDGIIAGSEECDDGNNDDEDGCSGVCVVEEGWSCEGEPSVCTPGCGDGIVAGSEQCDDGNTTDGDGCSSNCELEGTGSGGAGAGGAGTGAAGISDDASLFDLGGRSCHCNLLPNRRSRSAAWWALLGALAVLTRRRRR